MSVPSDVRMNDRGFITHILEHCDSSHCYGFVSTPGYVRVDAMSDPVVIGGDYEAYIKRSLDANVQYINGECCGLNCDYRGICVTLQRGCYQHPAGEILAREWWNSIELGTIYDGIMNPWQRAEEMDRLIREIERSANYGKSNREGIDIASDGIACGGSEDSGSEDHAGSPAAICDGADRNESKAARTHGQDGDPRGR